MSSGPNLVTAAAVREYMGLNSVSSDSRYSDDTIGSNIRAAGWYLERATGRTFEDVTATRKYTTNGATFLVLPGLRTASAVTLSGSALTADSTYYLIPDVQQSGVYTGIQFRAFRARSGGPAYLSNPEWFDRGLDMRNPYGEDALTSVPNDLSIAGDWGWADGDVPEPVLHAVKVLAAFYTKRPDALLSGAIQTPDGTTLDLSQLPVEVRVFIEEWRVTPAATGVG